ncbi:MAG TPA: hypothetical protein VFF30_18580 [Nitrososphaerales archaeon]|nr:hypothetical protein [Nitrososphaerales archaeon]
MPLPVGLYVAIGALLVIIAVFLVGMRGRGRLIECPECGERFRRPAFAQKHSGFGISMPGLGDYVCPKCNYKATTSSFRYVGEEEGKDTVGAKGSGEGKEKTE